LRAGVASPGPAPRHERYAPAPAAPQGLVAYNGSDGTTSVRIADAPLPLRPAPGAPPPRDPEALLRAAAAGGWGQAQWVKASNTRADASKWRTLVAWPFGEKGNAIAFDRRGTGLYVMSSLGRRACRGAALWRVGGSALAICGAGGRARAAVPRPCACCAGG
jgi:hypothetical protein